MQLTLRQLQIFVAVADSGSTAAAADLVSMTQSASSAALRELESILHCRLFDRIGKRLEINDNGHLLLQRARLLLSAADDIARDFSDAQTGGMPSLHIGCSTTIGIYLMPDILAAFESAHHMQPGRISVANTDDIVRAVAGFEVDAGLIEGYCHDPDLDVEPWLEDELLIVCAPGHPALRGTRDTRLSLAAMQASAWLLRERGSGTREAVENALLPRLHHIRPAAEFSNSESIKNAAVAGLGLACLSRLVVRDLLAQGKLVEVQTPIPPIRRRFYLVTAKKKVLSRRLDALLDHCRQWTI